MSITRCIIVCFSPTDASRRLAEAVAQGMGLPVTEHDITLPEGRDAPAPSFDGALVILAAPVYAGRIPVTASEVFAALPGNGAPAVLLVSYGNRHYDDALLELKDLAVGAGFRPLAGGAFVAEHSLDNEEYPMAPGRPDAADLQKARDFGKQAMAALQKGPAGELSVPGNTPYRPYPTGPVPAPVCTEACLLCGTCVDVCPTGAITLDDALVTMDSPCIFCQACVKKCPHDARVADSERARATRERLKPLMSTRREPELFFPSA